MYDEQLFFIEFYSGLSVDLVKDREWKEIRRTGKALAFK